MNTIRNDKAKLGFSRLRKAPPSRVSQTGESAVVPEDSFSASAQAAQSQPAKPGLTRRMLKIGVNTVLLGSSLAGAVGGVGIATNAEVLSEAMTQEKTVEVFGAETPKSSESTGKMVDLSRSASTDLGDLQKDLDLTHDRNSVSARLSGDKAQGLLGTLRQKSSVQSAVQKQLNLVEGKLETKLQELRIPGGETLLTARVPFPSGEGSILQVAGKSIPVGLRKLAMEEVPLVVDYQIDPVDTGLQVKLSPVEVERARMPEGVEKGLHLGSVRAEVLHPEKGHMEVSGRVRLSLDDGTATRRALEKTTDPTKRKALQERLQQIERLQKLSEDQNLEPVLDLLTENREVRFRGTLQGTSQKMGDGTVHAWLTPDHDGDQRGDLKLSGEVYTAAVDNMKFQVQELSVASDGSFLQEKVSKTAEGALAQSLPKVMDALRTTVKRKIGEKFQAELRKTEQNLDSRFDQSLDAAGESTSGVGVSLGRLDVERESGDLVARLQSEGELSKTLLPEVRVVGKKAAPQASREVSVASVASRSTVRVDRNKPAVVIPGSSARQFLNSLLESPDFQETLDTLTGAAKNQVEKMAGQVKGPSGSVKLEVETPFPSAAKVDSPLGALPKLTRKVLPFTADYRVDNFSLPLQLELKPVEVTEAVRPERVKEDGVFLGAIQVNTKPLSTEVSGEVQLKKHRTKGGAEWAEEAVDKAFRGQDFGFQSEVSVGESESMFYLWVVPDYTGDGRADIAVAHKSIKSGAEELKIDVQNVERRGEKPQGEDLGEHLNGVVGRMIEQQLENSGELLSRSVSGVLENKVSEFLGQGSHQAAGQINSHLSTLYGKIGELDIPVPEDMNVPGGKLSLKLGQVNVKGDNIISEYGNERTDRLLQSAQNGPQKTSYSVESGELQARVPGVVFNRLLGDRSAGGPLDWNGMLEKASKESSAVKSLRLAQDENGKTISPSMRMIDGKPTLTIQVDGETNGIATPVSAGARLLPGFLGDGLGWLSDNTVGAVLGARLQTEIQVPLEFQAEGDSLKVESGEIKFETPHKTDFDVMDILPTRLLSSLITEGVANAMGPDSVADLMQKADVKADLSQFGLQWARVEARGAEGQAPDFTFGVKLGKKLPDIVSEQVADMSRKLVD